VLAEVTEGLANLYELLPKGEKVTKKEVKDLIYLTNLKQLSTPMKNALAALTARHELLRETKERFIAVGLGILSVWLVGQGEGRVAIKDIEAMQEKLEQKKRSYPETT